MSGGDGEQVVGVVEDGAASGLAASGVKGAQVREAFAAPAYQPQEEDFVAFDVEGYWLGMYLSEVGEALGPLLVAGIAFPGVELPEELDALAERGAVLGLAGAVEHLSGLARCLREIGRHQRRRDRAPWVKRAWDTLQRLVAWLRLMQAESSLMAVEGNLVASYRGRVNKASAQGRTTTLDVWPLGVSLVAYGESLIFASEVETGQPVLLKDHFAEVNLQNPMQGTVISRLFQDALVLHTALNRVIMLSDHPYTQGSRGGIMSFSPGFKTIPKHVARPRDFREPDLAELALGEDGLVRWAVLGQTAKTLDIGWMRAEIIYNEGSGEASLVDEGRAPLPLEGSATLRLNLLKWLLRENSEERAWSRNRIRFVMLVQEDRLVPLNMTTAMDGRVFPGQDTLLFRLGREALAEMSRVRAEQARLVLLELMLKVEALRYGGGSEAQVGEVRDRLGKVRVYGVEQSWLRFLACLRIGAPGAEVVTLGREALVMATSASLDVVPESMAEQVLGRKKGGRSVWGELFGSIGGGAGLTPVGSAVLLRALMMVQLGGDAAEIQGLCEAIFDAHCGGPLHEPSVVDVCARALLMLMAGMEEEPPDLEMFEAEFMAHPDDAAPRLGRRAAAVFFMAHVDGLRQRGELHTLDMFELILMTHTRGLIFGNRGRLFLELGLSSWDLGLRCAGALVRFFVKPVRELLDQDFAEAIKALMLIAAAELSGWFVE